MAARTKAPWKADRYLELVHRFPLRPIRSDKELDQAIRVLDSLLDRTRLEPEEKDYLEVERVELEVVVVGLFLLEWSHYSFHKHSK